MLDDDCAQGGFEYLLLIGSAVFLVILVLLVTRSQVFTPVMNSSAVNATSIHNSIRNVT